MVLTEEALGVHFVNLLRARRPRRKPPILCDHLDAAKGVAVSGSCGESPLDLLAGQFGDVDIGCRQFLQHGLLFPSGGSVNAFVDRISQVPCEFTVDFAWIFSRARRDFRRKKARNDPVFVRGPDSAVARKKRGAGTFFARKAKTAIEQAFDKPLEANGHLIEAASQPSADTIDHTAADRRFADGNIFGPLAAA